MSYLNRMLIVKTQFVSYICFCKKPFFCSIAFSRFFLKYWRMICDIAHTCSLSFFASSSCLLSSACENSSSSLWQQMEIMPLTTTTLRTPIRNVKMELRRKHHHFRSFKHSSSDKMGFSVGMEVSSTSLVEVSRLAMSSMALMDQGKWCQSF